MCREIDKTVQTTSLDAKRERELIKEMRQIKDSEPFIRELEELRKLISEKKREKAEVGEPLAGLKEACAELKAKINAAKKGQEGK